MRALRWISLALLVLVLAGGGRAGYRAYDYVENDPQFCDSCHLMDTAFRSWEESVHWDVNCHECHWALPT